ncbi:MAG: AAA family ATPase [Proteobacteria bacterium]|nr:AAA family ATPase [Pseudomonadota bacterium]
MALGDIAAKLGMPVFPCAEDKRPIVAGGFKAASLDPAQILRAFANPSAQLIGVPTGSPSGLIAIDIDIRPGCSGMIWLDENSDALPSTRTHRTRSGGLHLLFRVPDGVEIRNSASRLAPGVDVRGEGGYIIMPPSPGYAIADTEDPAEMPRWLISACVRADPERPTTPPSGDRPTERYAQVALDAEIGAVMRAGEGTRNDTLNRAAFSLGQLVGAGVLSRGTVENELTRAAYAAGLASHETAPTIKSGIDAGVAFPREILEREPPRQKEKPQPTAEDAPDETEDLSELFALHWLRDINSITEAKDFVKGVLVEEGAAVIYGESNAGKTFWMTDLALHVAAGLAWQGRRVDQGGVIYCVLEGGNGFNNRADAWKKAHGLENQDIPFAAIKSTINLLNPDADTLKLIATIRHAAKLIGFPVKLIVIDTLSRAMAGGNENAPDDMGALVGNMDRIREATKACTAFIHHSGKDAAKGARGHSLLRAAIDTEIEVAASDGPMKTATVVKQRDLPKGAVFGFTLEAIVIGKNQHGEEVTTCLVQPSDADQAPGQKRTLTGHARKAHEILCDLLATKGLFRPNDRNIPEGLPSVYADDWRTSFYDRSMPGEPQDSKRKAFKRAASDLLDRKIIGTFGGFIWLV